MKLVDLICSSLFLSWSVGIIAQTTIEDTLRPRLKLQHADKVIITGKNNNEVYRISGNILLQQGETTLRCEKARFISKEQKAFLQKNVIIKEPERSLYADFVDYDGICHEETAYGHVIVNTANQILNARRVHYKQESSQILAQGNVILTDYIELAVLCGETVFYDRKIKYGKISGAPMLSKVDSVSRDTMFVWGKTMEIWGDEQKVLIKDSVRIIQGKLKAYCSHAEYWVEDGRLLLLDMPVIYQEDQELYADTIDITLEGSRLTSGHLTGNAHVISHDSLNAGKMTGREIIITSTVDSLRQVEIIGQATSIYNISDTDDTPGENTFTGDRIKLYFKTKKLFRLKVFSDPGTSTGKFIPLKKEIKADSTTVNTG
ncbi:hypothetical protein KAR48_06555 [bacterium]|nr:hypothetical protein [bacterium]